MVPAITVILQERLTWTYPMLTNKPTPVYQLDLRGPFHNAMFQILGIKKWSTSQSVNETLFEHTLKLSVMYYWVIGR